MTSTSHETDSLESHRTNSEDRDGTPWAIGILPDGSRFFVPGTLSVVSSLVKLRSWRSPATFVWITLGILTASTYWFYYVQILPKWFFCLQFVFWRVAYNLGIGAILHFQSKEVQFLKFFRQTVKTYPALVRILESSVVLEASHTEYMVEKYPDEFNAWMLFRVVVNIILANDLIAYMVLSLVCCKSVDFTSLRDVLCLLTGGGSIAFALWSKTDAHRVIGEYAWYWGDFFFLLDKKLVFDGIFQMFPHPMYTVGYAFMYGVPLMAKSYTLFYLSVFGHLSQLLFLAFVENPHIDRTYNTITERTEEEKLRDEILYNEAEGFLSRDELIVLLNFNPLRTTDFLLCLLVLHAGLLLFLPLPGWCLIIYHVLWRLFLNGLLGAVLHREVGHDKWFSKMYATSQEAFSHWCKLFNTGVVMANTTFVICALHFFTWDMPYLETLESRIFTVVVGTLLVGINVYVSLGIYEVIGAFGYFYGDFFVEGVPSTLTYNGIYRYLNNPDTSLGMSGYYGVALISGSWIIFLLALFSHLCTKLFELLIEKPYMQQRYGHAIRSVSGIEQELKKKLRNAKNECDKKIAKLKEDLERQYRSYDTLKERTAARRRKSKDD